MMEYADSHLHPRGADYPGSESASLLSVCAAQFSDWETISEMNDPRIVRSYGVHPWYSESWTDGSVDRLREVLENDPKANVGEIGLDEAKGPSMVEQARCFEEQFMLASELGRTVSIHSVRTENYVLAAVKRNRKGCRAVVLHSFMGPANYVQSFAKHDCYFSISPRMLNKQESVAKAILETIPKDRLLIETDSPDSGPNLVSAEDFISKVASLLSMDATELASITLENAERAFR